MDLPQLLPVHEGCEMNDSSFAVSTNYTYFLSHTLVPGRSQPTTQRVQAIKRLGREATPIVEINKARNFSITTALLHVT